MIECVLLFLLLIDDLQANRRIFGRFEFVKSETAIDSFELDRKKTQIPSIVEGGLITNKRHHGRRWSTLFPPFFFSIVDTHVDSTSTT